MKSDSKRLPFNRTESYSLLKFATEKFMVVGVIVLLIILVKGVNKKNQTGA